MVPSEVLKDACRRLEGHAGTRVVDPLDWDEREGLWVLHVELEVESANAALVPAVTRWYVTLSPRFPWGDVVVYPAKEMGLDKTFPHQSHNGPGPKDRPWRAGNLCVREPAFDGRSGADLLGEEGRLAWYVDRARLWLRRASEGTLFRLGGPFELPQFSSLPETIAFNEAPGSFASTSLLDAPHGTAELVSLGSPFPLVVRRLLSKSGAEVLAPPWGLALREKEAFGIAAWLRLPALPLVPPYGAPQTYGELFQVMEGQGLRPENILADAISPLRGRHPAYLLVGFPVPERVGEAASQVHWQPILLPQLSSPRNAKGFRNGPTGLWRRDMASSFRQGASIIWLTGSNWNDDQLGRRGVLSAKVRSSHVVVLGAGALGSMVAELLARGGVKRFTVVDGDRLSAGNLTRHTLDVSSVGAQKAQALAGHLNAVSPHLSAVAVTGDFPSCLRGAGHDMLADADVVVDCSASDDVIAALAEVALPERALFLSASIGPGARKLYMFLARGPSFPSRVFFEASLSLLERDRAAVAGEEQWEGIGCWHPVFPARVDVVARFAVAVVRSLATAVDDEGASMGLQVVDGGPDDGH